MGTGASGVTINADELIALRFKAQVLSLRPGARVGTYLSGGHHSAFRGRGIDFDESRNYQPGDDIRHMDWRVTARSGRPHTKVFREERERPVLVVLDRRSGMWFGTRVAYKAVAAARAAALVAWTAAGGGDRVGAMSFDESGHHESRPASGRRGVLRVIRTLAAGGEARSGGNGALAQVARRLRRVTRPGALILLFSDFSGLDDETRRHLGRVRLHADLVPCLVYDPLEAEPPPPGRYAITDGERRATLDTGDPAVRRAYVDPYVRRRDALDAAARELAVPWLALRTDQDPVPVLREALAGRARPRMARRAG